MLVDREDRLAGPVLGVAVTGLLAAFMAGMAANVSAFNTVFTYDIWQAYIKKDRPDGYYLRVGRTVLVFGIGMLGWLWLSRRNAARGESESRG